jgi:hypothetical protein
MKGEIQTEELLSMHGTNESVEELLVEFDRKQPMNQQQG